MYVVVKLLLEILCNEYELKNSGKHFYCQKCKMDIYPYKNSILNNKKISIEVFDTILNCFLD